MINANPKAAAIGIMGKEEDSYRGKKKELHAPLMICIPISIS